MSKNNNFKWKVSVYRNINGQEQSYEKEFDSQEEYESFLQNNDFGFWSSGFSSMWNAGLWGIVELMDSFFDRKLENWFGQTSDGFLSENEDEVDLDMRKLEEKARHLEQKEKIKERKKQMLENKLEKLKKFKKRFKKHDKDEELKETKEAIDKVKNKLKEL